MKEDKNLIVEILKFARFLILLGLLAGVSVFLYTRMQKPVEPEISASYVSNKLEAVSDLTTAKLFYTGFIRYSEGSIPFLTQNSFSMIYTATVRAGIDLSKAEVMVTENQVKILLPACEVQSIEIDPDSIEFYDERMALFNWSRKEDVTDTISAARADLEQKADIGNLLDSARRQTESIIRGLLAEAIGDRTLVLSSQ